MYFFLTLSKRARRAAALLTDSVVSWSMPEGLYEGRALGDVDVGIIEPTTSPEREVFTVTAAAKR